MTVNRNYNYGRSFVAFNSQPHSRYFIQKYNLPGFTLNEATQETPYQAVSIPGSNITWNPFSATFILDEEMKVWYEIWQWIKSNNGENKTEDFSMYIYNNTVKRFVMRIDFSGAWVNQENDIEIADFTTTDDTEPKLLTVFFKYAYYNPVLLDESSNNDIIEGV